MRYIRLDSMIANPAFTFPALPGSEHDQHLTLPTMTLREVMRLASVIAIGYGRCQVAEGIELDHVTTVLRNDALSRVY